MTEPKLLNTSPNPDKLKNKMDIEEKWAQTILTKNPEDKDIEFVKELQKFNNPIQIWIKSQVLSNLGLECAKDYMDKAKELGYSTDSVIEESVNLTSFSDGTFVFSTKDTKLADKIKSLINENLKQEFQYDKEQQFGPWTWNMFNEDDKLKINKKEYNADALIQLIRNDNFLKFQFHNLSSGDNDKDLDMIWKKFVKEDPAYSVAIKTFEGYVNYYAEKNITKFDFYNKLSSLIEEAKLTVNIIDVCNFIDSFAKKNILESIELKSRIELKNVLSELKSKGIVEKLNSSELTYTDFDLNLCSEKLRNTFSISEDLSKELYKSYLLPILSEGLQFYHIGNKEFTSLYNILCAVILTNELK